MLLLLSKAGAPPDIQMPPSRPFGESLKVETRAIVEALKPIIHTWYGGLSPCEAHATYTMPFASASPAGCPSRSGQKGTLPGVLVQPSLGSPVSPVPETVIAGAMSTAVTLSFPSTNVKAYGRWCSFA